MLHWHVLPISNRFQVIRSFRFGCDFPTGGENWVVLGENVLQKLGIAGNTCCEGTSLRQTTSFEPLCVIISSRAWAASVVKNQKHTNQK